MANKDTFGSYDPSIAASFVAEKEGFRSKAYTCSAGVWTIGYGHTGDVKEGDRITKEAAKALLINDLAKHAEKMMPYVNVEVTKNQYIALLSWAFNCWDSGGSSSQLLKRLNSHDSDGAAEQFLRWCYSGKKVVPGLLARRKAERELFLKDSDND